MADEAITGVSGRALAGIAETDCDGRFTRVNDRYCSTVGYSREELVGRRRMQDITAADDLPRVLEKWGRLLLDGTPFEIEKRYVRKDGSRVWVHNSVSAVRDGSDRVNRLMIVSLDITERMSAEEALRGREQQLAAEAAALTRLNAAGSRLWATEDEREGLDEVLSAAIDLLGADMGNVQLLDAGRGVLRIAAQRGFEKDFLDYFREVTTDDDSACGRALRAGGRIVVEDVETDEPYAPLRPVARAAGYRAVQSTPLIARDGRPMGMISTHFRAPYRPDERALQWLDLFVRLATDFLDRCRTANALRESEARQAFLLRLSDALRPLADPVDVQAAAARLLGERLGASRVGYAESDDGGETFVVRQQHAAGVPELAGRLRTVDIGAGPADHLRAGRRVVWADVAHNPALSAAEREAFAAAGIAAEAVAPLVKAGRLVAVLFAHFQRPHAWTPVEVALLDDTAERTWTAVERAKAEAALLRSRNSFLGLVHNAPFGVYLVDASFRLVEVSSGSQKVFGGVRPLLGRDFAEVMRVIWAEPFASHVIDRFRHTLATGEPCHSADTTEQRQDVPGVESYDWRIERVTTPDGGFGVVCYFYDTTALKRAAARDAFRARLADALRPLADPDEIKVTACRLLVQHLAAGRASYAEVEPDGAHVVITAEATDGMPSFVGRHRADDFGPAIVADIRAGRTVAISDITRRADLTEAEQAAHAAFDIRALVAVPLIKRGRWEASLGINAAGPRAWAADEVALIEEVAERTWAAVERAKAEAALRESAERLRLTIRASNIGLWDWDLDTDVVEYSPEWKAQLGYAVDEIRSTFGEWRSRVHPDDLGPTLDRVRRTLEGFLPAHEAEFRMRHKDGSWRWMFARAEVIRDADGAAVRLLGCHIDVTARKLVEESLREREARLTTILNTAADALITIDRAGVIETVNPAAERMFGYAPGELTGRTISVLMPPPHRDRYAEYLARFVSTGEPRVIGVDRGLHAVRKDGTAFPIELSVSEIDHLQQFTGIIRDITRRKELEREVVEATTEEQRRIGQDLHDTVGQELTALALQASDLADALRTDPPAAPGLADRIGRGLRRCQRELRAVIRGLLPVAVDCEGLMAALADLATRTAREGRVACTFDCPTPVTVRNNLTATQLYLIAQEAVHNAVKHARARAVRVSLARLDDGGFVLRVADDGSGLPVSQPTRHGRGLRIMHHRATIIGARLTIGPAAANGTVVTCEFPGGSHGQG